MSSLYGICFIVYTLTMRKDKFSGKIIQYDVVFEEAEEGGYTVFVPSLPGCISEGDTFEQAKDNITEAIGAYLESLAKEGEEVKEERKNFFIGKVEIPLANLSL